MVDESDASTPSLSDSEELLRDSALLMPMLDVGTPPADLLPGTLHCDLNEPHKVFGALGQTGTPFSVSALNTNGHSDYAWLTVTGRHKEVERKTWGEILTSVDRVEEQMLRHLRNYPMAEHVLLLEGLAVQSPGGSSVMQPARGGTLFVRGHSYRPSLGSIYAWLYQMSHYITILPTIDTLASATALSAMFNSDQKESHATLNRHIVLHNFQPDPVVTMIMALLKGVGEKRALAIKEKFPTVYSLVCARPQDLMAVEGIGPGLAHEIPRRLGSPYV